MCGCVWLCVAVWLCILYLLGRVSWAAYAPLAQTIAVSVPYAPLQALKALLCCGDRVQRRVQHNQLFSPEELKAMLEACGSTAEVRQFSSPSFHMFSSPSGVGCRQEFPLPSFPPSFFPPFPPSIG